MMLINTRLIRHIKSLWCSASSLVATGTRGFKVDEVTVWCLPSYILISAKDHEPLFLSIEKKLLPFIKITVIFPKTVQHTSDTCFGYNLSSGRIIKCTEFQNSMSSEKIKTLLNTWQKTNMDPLPQSRSDPVIMKLESPEFRSLFTPELRMLTELFTKYNHEIRIAGGAVRDLLMGMKPKDLDFATTATPDEMKEMFTKEEIRMINAKGEKHGTVTPRINDKENFEVTTLRIDVLTNGRHAEVEFTKNWKLDANRRDLTINSMFLDLKGNVYDYFFGYDDLIKKRVAFVGNAATRIREDYLRILRYFRFYGRIAEDVDKHDAATIDAIKENVSGLERISGERIWNEWTKILEGRFGGELTLKMIDCGVSNYVGLPKNPDVENFDRIYRRALANGLILRPITLVSSMLRDQEEVMKLHMRLKLSAYERDLALFLVQHREDKPCEKALKPYHRLILNPKGKVQDVREFVSEVLKYRGAVDLLREFEMINIPKFPVNGNMLKPHISHPKMIGPVMTILKDLWLEKDFKLTADELMKHVPEITADLEERKQ